jgi:hypothetical protein
VNAFLAIYGALACLAVARCRAQNLVTQIFTSWNRVTSWLGQIDSLRQVA